MCISLNHSLIYDIHTSNFIEMRKEPKVGKQGVRFRKYEEIVGDLLGSGATVGAFVGDLDGDLVGAFVGDMVGLLVGAGPENPPPHTQQAWFAVKPPNIWLA